MEKISRSRLIFILGLLSAIGPFSVDMYLPAFPTIAATLNTTPDKVSYSLASYFIGICAGQILIGPLLDRYGRKRPLYGGMILYIVSSIGCAFAPTIEALIFFRFFQAGGGCVGIVAPRAIVRDVFPVNEIARIFSMLILIIGVSPIIAPTVGGLMTAHFGWHSIFVVLAVITCLILIAVVIFLPESKQPDATFSLRPKPILQSYAKVITHPQFYTYALTGASASAGLYAYLSGSPYVFMDLYHLSEQQYGWIFALVAGGLITSSQINNLLLKKFNSDAIIRIVLIFQSVVALVLITGTFWHWLGLAGTIACIFFYLCCQGFSFPNSSALSMAPFTREAGSASALMGSIQMALGATASALVGLFSNGTAIPMTGVMAGCTLTALLVLTVGRRLIIYRMRKADLQEHVLEMIEKH